MRFTVALVALAAAVAAPLASAQTCATTSNNLVLGNLAATSIIKKTTVTGGHRIVQSVAIKNNGAATAGGLQFKSVTTVDAPFLKGNARVLGSSKPTVTATGNNVISSVFSIPAGKTLKATVSYKAVKCPTLSQPQYMGGLAVTIPTDANALTTCLITKPATMVTIKKRSVGCSGFIGQANGLKSVPPIVTSTTAFFQLSPPDSSGTFTWTLNVHNVTNMTMAHIHYGNANTNGPIVVGLVPTAQDNTTTSSGLPMLANPVSGTVNFTSTFTSADFQSNFAGKKDLQFEKAAAKGLLYVNIHTVDYPNGIVRGQLVPASAFIGTTAHSARNTGLHGGA